MSLIAMSKYNINQKKSITTLIDKTIKRIHTTAKQEVFTRRKLTMKGSNFLQIYANNYNTKKGTQTPKI